jgi:hypothetical protein
MKGSETSPGIGTLRHQVRCAGHVTHLLCWGRSGVGLLVLSKSELVIRPRWQDAVPIAFLVIFAAAFLASRLYQALRMSRLSGLVAQLPVDAGLAALAPLAGDRVPETRWLASTLLLDLQARMSEVIPAPAPEGRGMEVQPTAPPDLDENLTAAPQRL